MWEWLGSSYQVYQAQKRKWEKWFSSQYQIYYAHECLGYWYLPLSRKSWLVSSDLSSAMFLGGNCIANIMDPDQTAPFVAVWSWFILFASMKKSSLKCTWIYMHAVDVKSRHFQKNIGGIRAKVNQALGHNFFISWFTNPPTLIFCKVEKKNYLLKSFLYFIHRL